MSCFYHNPVSFQRNGIQNWIKKSKCNCSIKAPSPFYVTPIKERQGFQKLCCFDFLKPLCKCPCTECQLGIQFKRLKAISWGPHCPSEKKHPSSISCKTRELPNNGLSQRSEASAHPSMKHTVASRTIL